jgi:fructoselysine 6-phosphate deglycase
LTGRSQLNSLFYVGVGGRLSQFHVSKYAVDREARVLVADAYNAAEFMARDLPRLNSASAVILCDTPGTYPETVAAARFAREHGAYTIAVTPEAKSPLAEGADITIGYDANHTTCNADSGNVVLLRLTLGILRDREGNTRYDALMRSLPPLPDILARALEARKADVLRWAAESKREPLIYTMASGPNYGVAYSCALCFFQEYQWIHSQPIHSDEYFGGPVECTDFDVPFVVLVGIGPCREMDLRAAAFARKISQRVLVLDAGDIDFSGVDAEVLDYVQTVVLLPLLRAFPARLAEERGHPLTVTRYMWKNLF